MQKKENKDSCNTKSGMILKQQSGTKWKNKIEKEQGIPLTYMGIKQFHLILLHLQYINKT